MRPFNSLSKGICVSQMSLGITAPRPQTIDPRINPKIDPIVWCWLKDKVFQFGAHCSPKTKTVYKLHLSYIQIQRSLQTGVLFVPCATLSVCLQVGTGVRPKNSQSKGNVMLNTPENLDACAMNFEEKTQKDPQITLLRVLPALTYCFDILSGIHSEILSGIFLCDICPGIRPMF